MNYTFSFRNEKSDPSSEFQFQDIESRVESNTVIIPRPKGLHPGVSKDFVKCPVENCSKDKIRRDNWVSHIKNKVICGSDQKPVSRKSQEFRKASKDKQNHTLFFIDGGFSLDNLPSPPVVEETVKEKNRNISSMIKQLQAVAPASLEAEAGAGETCGQVFNGRKKVLRDALL